MRALETATHLMVGAARCSTLSRQCSSSPASRHPSSRPGAAGCSSTSRPRASAAASSSTTATSSTSRASTSSPPSARSASRSNAAGEPRGLRPRVRGRARARRDHVRARSSRTRSTRGSSTRCSILGDVLEDMGIVGAIGADNDGYPGILGYQGPSLSEVIGGHGDAARAADREHDGAEERGRGGADPRERALVRARPPAAAGVQRPRLDRGQAGLRAGYETTLAMLEALGPGYSGQLSSTDGASAGLSRPGRAAQRLGPRRRPQHPVRGGPGARHRDGRARSGATTPSSSAR